MKKIFFTVVFLFFIISLEAQLKTGSFGIDKNLSHSQIDAIIKDIRKNYYGKKANYKSLNEDQKIERKVDFSWYAGTDLCGIGEKSGKFSYNIITQTISGTTNMAAVSCYYEFFYDDDGQLVFIYEKTLGGFGEAVMEKRIYLHNGKIIKIIISENGTKTALYNNEIKDDNLGFELIDFNDIKNITKIASIMAQSFGIDYSLEDDEEE